MATIRCPQCGTDVEEGSSEFCPNPNCGFPLSFSKEPEAETEEIPMERRPLEQAPVTPTVPRPQPPPPVTPTPVVPPPPTPPPPKGGGANPALLIAGVLVAVAVIAAVVIFVAGGDDEPDEPASKPPPEETAELTFTRVPADEVVFGGESNQYMHRVVAGEDQLIAIGSDGPPGAFDGAVWTSADGQVWTRVSPTNDPLLFGGEGEQEMLGITRGPEGKYVIVGRDNSGEEGDDAAVWTYDGLVFRRVPPQEVLGGTGKQVMTRVIRGAQRYIAVGTTEETDDGTPDAGLWLSVDGEVWAKDDSQLSLKGEGDQFMRTIVPFEEGFVGAGRELTDDYDAAVWKADTETTSFRRTGTDQTFGGPAEQQVYTVATGGPGLVAVGVAGSGGNPDAAVWISEDGDVWSQVLDDAVLGGPGTQLMLGVTSTPAGLIAVGYDGAQVPDGVHGDEAKVYFDGALWQSADGDTWERVLIPSFGGAGEQQIKSVAVYDDTIVAVGWDGSGGDVDAAVWTAPLP